MFVVGFVMMMNLVSIVYSSSDDDDESFRISFCFGFRNTMSCMKIEAQVISST